MLRKLVLKNREIPIPVPIQTLGDAVQWIEETLLKKDAIVTSVVLEERELINELYRKSVKETELHANSRLQIKIDTPKDLSIQSLDVVCDLAYAIASRLKRLAVDCWQDLHQKPKSDLEEIHADVQLLLDLIAHINGLVDGTHSYLGPINGLGHLIGLANAKFAKFLAEQNWRELASILVNRLDPYLKELAREGETLQINILTDHLDELPLATEAKGS